MNLPYKNENPWKIIKKEEIYDSPWIKLIRHEVIHPSGNPGEYSVTQFKNHAIGILPLDDETHMFYKHKHNINKICNMWVPSYH